MKVLEYRPVGTENCNINLFEIEDSESLLALHDSNYQTPIPHVPKSHQRDPGSRRTCLYACATTYLSDGLVRFSQGSVAYIADQAPAHFGLRHSQLTCRC